MNEAVLYHTTILWEGGVGRTTSTNRNNSSILFPTMVFVYTGKGRRQAQREDAPPEQKHCAKQACAIQWCLAKRDHKEELCQNFIREWEDCRDKAVRAAEATKKSKMDEVLNGEGHR